jgi:hypothetical protein
MRMADTAREAAMARIAELVGLAGRRREVLNGAATRAPVRAIRTPELLRRPARAQRQRPGALSPPVPDPTRARS